MFVIPKKQMVSACLECFPTANTASLRAGCHTILCFFGGESLQILWTGVKGLIIIKSVLFVLSNCDWTQICNEKSDICPETNDIIHTSWIIMSLSVLCVICINKEATWMLVSQKVRLINSSLTNSLSPLRNLSTVGAVPPTPQTSPTSLTFGSWASYKEQARKHWVSPSFLLQFRALGSCTDFLKW